jgi:adenylate cyclase
VSAEPVAGSLGLRDLRRCFDGRIPAIVATASGSGIPNITHLSLVHQVDAERLALSNQFMSKTSRNVAENPRASLIVVDPVSFSEYRLTLRYERTDRRGPVFERLRDDVDKVAALSGMRDVFRLRSADIFIVDEIHVICDHDVPAATASRHQGVGLAACGELAARMSRSLDLGAMVATALDGMDQLLGYRHSTMLMLDEQQQRLFTLASHGFPAEGVGSEVAVGDGIAGAAAQTCRPVRAGGLQQMQRYSEAVRRSFEREGAIGAAQDIPLPALDDAASRLAVPAMVKGELVGVLVVESPLVVAFDDDDEAVLSMVATLIAQMAQLERADLEASGQPDSVVIDDARADHVGGANSPDEIHVRFYLQDGSIFLGGEYLIRGVAGRVLWSLLQRFTATGQREFANKELRLDKSLDLPGYRDNLDTRLVLLRRRLDEREAPIRIERTTRGRFRMDVSGTLRLDQHD